MIETLEFDDVNVMVCPVGLLKTNCYIVNKKGSNKAIVIDPGDMGSFLIETIKKAKLDIVAIFLTHGHFDHIGAIEEIKEEFDVKVYISEDDKELMNNPEENCSNMFRRKTVIKPDEFFKDEQTIEIEGVKFKVFMTPGHTKGSASFYFENEKILFSGDTLFKDSIGRTDFPTGSARSIVTSIRQKLFALEDDVKVFTGHGESTTIGYERENNIYVYENFF